MAATTWAAIAFREERAAFSVLVASVDTAGVVCGVERGRGEEKRGGGIEREGEREREREEGERDTCKGRKEGRDREKERQREGQKG